ncbi:MAG: DUF3999 domain-containing protein [Deltaproteobacteria bacterium]|nr:DUF3999 domain-containing protein [Deltaproteobacteria bacterium]
MFARIFCISLLSIASILPCGSMHLASAEPANVSVSRKDFAFGRTIEVAGQSPLNVFEVPEDVYRVVTRSNLGDVRVFGSGGTVVPHEIVRIDPLVENTISNAAIPLFPIEGDSMSLSGNQAVEVSQDASGRMLRVWVPGNTAKTQTRTSYLLDLREFKQPLIGFSLNTENLPANRIINVQVEGSDDLESWRPMSATGVLARLTYVGQNIEQNSFEFSSAAPKYLRISFPDGDAVTLSGVQGRFLRTESRPMPERWLNLSTSADPEKPTTFLFDSGGFFPVQMFRAGLPQVNTLVRVRLSSRANAQMAWVPRFSGTLYRLATKDGELTTPAQTLSSVTTDRVWRLEIEGRDSQLGAGLPTLQLGWIPNELYFMAQGQAPFEFVYGSARAARADFGLPNLAALSKGRGGSPERAVLGEAHEIGGAASTVAPKIEEPLPWKKWTLWAVLIGFLAVVALMAKRLAQELKNS